MLSNPLALARRLSARKNEFESSTAYHDRLARLVPDSYLAFRIVGPCQSSYTYDADQESVTVAPSTNDIVFGMVGLTMPVVMAFCSLETVGSYVGQNAFGVKKRIEIERSQGFAFRSDHSPVGSSRLTFHLSPDSARALSNDDAERAPDSGAAVEMESETSHATIDSPTERHNTAMNMLASDLWLWVYDRRTGCVIAKLRLVE